MHKIKYIYNNVEYLVAGSKDNMIKLWNRIKDDDQVLSASILTSDNVVIDEYDKLKRLTKNKGVLS